MEQLIDIYDYPIKDVLKTLLLNKSTKDSNIIWASSNISVFGDWYLPDTPLFPANLDICDLRPRVLKDSNEKKGRTKKHAEVFTAAWTCNKINNLCDEQWFGRKNVFNVIDEKKHTWVETDKVEFSKEKGKTWKDYIDTKYLEITCGEAPFLVSRYDASTGEVIPLHKRVGVIDRKIRVINENTPGITKDKWVKLVVRAYENTYGYEYQGDNLLVGRINLLLTFVDYYEDRWKEKPTVKELRSVAHKICWNLIQMDGFTYKVPYSDTYCVIQDWRSKLKVEVGTMKRINPEGCKKEVKTELKFDYVIGNPPYQGDNHRQIYPDFFEEAKTVVKDNGVVCQIFPSGWQEPKSANNLGKMNKEEIKADRQIVCIDNRDDAFPGILGAKNTNIILWKKGYDNGLEGKQLIYTNGENPEVKQLVWDKKNVEIAVELAELNQIVQNVEGSSFKALQTTISVRKPYGLSTDIVDDYKKYDLPPLQFDKIKDNDILVYGQRNRVRNIYYIPIDYPLPRRTLAFDKYKVIIPYAWGGAPKDRKYNTSFSDIIIARPNEICTESYIEIGCFNDYETAKKMAKYLMTKFCRALLFVNKTTQHSTTAFGAIPIQDFSENWWVNSVKDIDKELYNKYKLPDNIVKFIEDNIKERTTENIVNYVE